MKYAGRVHRFGDDVNTDEIIPARYLNTSDPAELARWCMEDARPGFGRSVEPGAIMVAGRNFGCGSSREHAPIAIKHAGLSCVVADSFARIFFRNAINIGLPIIECPGIGGKVAEGERLEVDLDGGAHPPALRRAAGRHPLPPLHAGDRPQGRLARPTCRGRRRP